MKLYTKTGDDGTTSLYGGGRVDKDDPRIEACGTIDELNAALGVAASGCTHEQVGSILGLLQNRLFDLGADVATPVPRGSIPTRTENPEGAAPSCVKSDPVSRISGPHVEEIEEHIDTVCERLPPLRRFILPGGSERAARIHLARSICRRAERCCRTLQRHDTVNPQVLIYLNRVSDLLFALGRLVNQLERTADVPWEALRQIKD